LPDEYYLEILEMTKDEAIEILSKGRFDEWNAYRKLNPKWIPNLRGYKFPKMNYPYTVLNLCDADLRDVVFPFHFLALFELNRTNLQGADLSAVGLFDTHEADTYRLNKAKYSHRTKWPPGFNPMSWGAVLVSEAPSLQAHSPKVFISYAWADKTPVLAIDQWLRNKGLDTKIDERDFSAGTRIRDAIFEVMKTCEAILIFYSDASKAKPWTEFERELAGDLEIEAKKEGRKPPRIIYVVMGDLELPNVTERNRIAVMTKGKRFPVVCEEIYRGILGLTREAQSIDLADWEAYEF
jgi:hypothetical protein